MSTNRQLAWDNSVVRWKNGSKGSGATGWANGNQLLVPRRDGLHLYNWWCFGKGEFIPLSWAFGIEGLHREFVEAALVARDRWLEVIK